MYAVSVIGQNNAWEKPYAGNNPNLLYYPDQNAVYFRYGWENVNGRELVIKGKMPDARYFSFNLYNDYTKSTVAALADYEIVPDAGDSNSYTIHILPSSAGGNYQNQIILPDSIRLASVFLRYYVARGNIYANKPLPSIFFVDNGITKEVPPSIPIRNIGNEDLVRLKKIIEADPSMISSSERKTLQSPTASTEDKERVISKVMTLPIFKHYTNPNVISAYNFNSSGNYPNKDNHYIVMPVVRQKKELLVVRFRMPSYTKRLGDNSKNVRYCSVSQGNEYTNTSITLYDEQLRVSDDGFVYVVVAKDGKEVRAKVDEMGINFMPWMHKDKIVLILRHMLPSPHFENSTKAVVLFDKSKPAKGQEAERTIGDFALIGKLLSKASWQSVKSIDQLGF